MLLLYLFTLVIFTPILVAQDEELTPSCKKEVSNACALVTCGPVENGLPGRDGKVGPKGEKGDPGLPGPRGPPGLIGNTGPIGPKGDKGSPGDPGSKGNAGERGLPGAQGLPGSLGSKGSPGPQGEKGAQGERGPKGEDGAKGPAGSPGPAGKRGSRGPSGPKGDRGSPGKKGECCLEETNKLKQEVAELHENIENLQKQFSEQQKVALFPSGRAVGKKIFKTTGFKGNFEEAMKSCKTAGGIVASPRNKAENKAVQEIVSTYKELAFLGMTDTKTEGKFIYPAGEPLGYSNWNSKEPNNKGGGENCIEIFSDGKWNDKPCEEPHLIICEFSLEEM